MDATGAENVWKRVYDNVFAFDPADENPKARVGAPTEAERNLANHRGDQVAAVSAAEEHPSDEAAKSPTGDEIVTTAAPGSVLLLSQKVASEPSLDAKDTSVKPPLGEAQPYES